MLGKTRSDIYKNYFGVLKFTKQFPDENACEQRLIELKYPNGFQCHRCEHTKFYRLKGPGGLARSITWAVRKVISIEKQACGLTAWASSP